MPQCVGGDATFSGIYRHLRAMKLRVSALLGIIGILPFQVWAADLPSAGSHPAGLTPKDPYAAPSTALSCAADATVSFARCEGGICLTEAPGGVAGDHAVFKGKVESTGVTGLLVYVQQQHSKMITAVHTANALKPGGQFEITVPLPQLGSYIVSIQATRVGGNPLVISARVSRIVAPHDMTASAVTISEPADGKDHVAIHVDLEKSCRELAKVGLPKDCDLIGSQTGATTVTAVNRLASGRQITRSTNAGTEGQFNLCMPLGDGQNVIEVQVCSPALPSCVTLTSKTISFSKSEPAVRWLDFEPGHLRFAMDHWTSAKVAGAACDGELQMKWNRDRVIDTESHKMDFTQRLCPINGEYRIASQPVSGVNELTILIPGDATAREFHYTFGWGHPVWAKDVAAGVMGMHVDHGVVDRVLPGIINRFLESDQFPFLIASLLEGGEKPPTQTPPDEAVIQELAEIRGAIPACHVGGGKPTKTRVVGTVKVGAAHLDAVSMSIGKIKMDISLEHVMIPLQIFQDANRDGLPDKGFLPLRIAFKKLHLSPAIVVKNPTQILLTSETDDCTFKPATYCKHQPAIFLPGQMEGEATKGGAIVACDDAGQMGPPDLNEKCASLDIVNMQTGQLSATIIDTLNETLYCDVSTQLTYSLRHAHLPVDRDFEVLGRKFSWKSKVALDANGFKLGTNGITLSLGSSMSGDGFYYASSSSGAGAPVGHSLGLMVREDVVNQALSALVALGQPGEGLLDWTLDEKTFAAMGFDFETACNATGGKEKSPLCVLRPRLNELLGTDLTTANYYSPDQPMRITTRRAPNSPLAPHVRFRQADAGEMAVDLDIPDLELAFSAIPKDVSKSTEPVITARMTILLSFTLDKISTHAADPSQLAMNIRLRRDESRVAVMPVAGSNRTLLPDHVLVGKLRSLIGFGLDLASKPDKHIPPIKIPKSFLLPATRLSGGDDSLLSRFGLAEIQFADGKLQWGLDTFSHALTFTADPILLQRLLMNGAMQEFRWGE